MDVERTDDDRARAHRSQTALGERGTAWWEQSPQERRARWKAGLPIFCNRPRQGPRRHSLRRCPT